MERKPLHLPGLLPPVEPNKTAHIPAAASERGYNDAHLDESVVNMWAASYKQESEWMISRFPDHHSELSQIVLRQRYSSGLFTFEDTENVAPGMDEGAQDDSANAMAEFINMTVEIGSDATTYENIKRLVQRLKTTRAASQRLTDSLCVMSASSFAGQSGDYTIAAIAEATPAKIARNLPQLFDGYLDALAEFEASAKLDSPHESSTYVSNTSPLMQEPLTRELVKKAFFNASLLYATMTPYMQFRAQYEHELMQHIQTKQQEGVVPEGSKPIQHLRAYMQVSAKFALFFDSATQAMLDPTHPQHLAILNSIRQHRDCDMVDLVLLQMCGAAGSSNMEKLRNTYEDISSLANLDDCEGGDVFKYLQASIESYIHTHELVLDEPDWVSDGENETDQDDEDDEDGEHAKLSSSIDFTDTQSAVIIEATPPSAKVRPTSEIGDMKRKMAAERRRAVQKAQTATSESTNLSPFPTQKRLVIEDHALIGSQIGHLPDVDQALVMRAILYYQEFGLGMRKVRSAENKYRLRAGEYRLIFSPGEGGGLRFLEVVRKSNSTYKKL